MYEIHNLDVSNLTIEKSFDLLYFDPPYGPKPLDIYFGIGNTIREYITWLRGVVEHLTLGHSDFNLVMHVDHKAVHYVKVMLDSIFGYKAFKNEIIWCYSGPNNAKTHFPRKHNNLLWYSVGRTFYQETRVPYKSLSSAKGSSWGGITDVDMYLNRGKLLEDFWTDIQALQRNENEKVGYPTQKPIKLLERLIRALCRKNHTVVDPMMGSGTTGVAALNLGRRFIGNDISVIASDTAKARISKINRKYYGD